MCNKKLRLASVFTVLSFLVCSSAAVTLNTDLTRLGNLVQATTTSTLLTNQERCDAIKYPSSSNSCSVGICDNGYSCKYYQSAATANIAYCKCTPDATTTTTLEQSCASIKNPSATACEPGICPIGSSCKYVQSAATVAVIGSCKCLPDSTTTTTLQPNCELIRNANEKACMNGLCPDGYDCKYVQSAATVAVIGQCKCIPHSTTTTIASSRLCEYVTPANEKTCMVGVCPPNYNCKYMSMSAETGGSSAATSYCKCIPATTTTTLQGRCEAVTPANANTCAAGLCPQGAKCVYKPSSSPTALLSSAPVIGSCVCDYGTTTTTLYPRCEEITPAGQAVCRRGLCPPDQVCRFKQNNQLTAMVANVPSGSCNCVPCDCDNPTTTTLPSTCEDVLGMRCPSGTSCSCQCMPFCVTTSTIPQYLDCMKVTAPSANSCGPAKCPEGQKCRLVTYTVGAGQISKCACIGGETTTTQPVVNCEGLIAGGQEKCDVAGCPPDMKCKYYSPTSANSVGVCHCVGGSRPTTTLQQSCENVANPSANTCAPAKCPEGQKCKVYTVTLASQQISKCICQSEETTTTLNSGGCEAITNAGGATCAHGECPGNTKCTYVVEANTAAAQIGRCKCLPVEATTTTLPRGFVERILKAIFG